MGTVTVLLIEDDPMVREVNRGFIEKVEGFHVVGFAPNGKEGLKQIENLKPELVLMDIYMPEQDGVATIQKIREKAISTEVIAVTAANDQQTIQKVLQYGAFDYVMKPFTFERMKQALENYKAYRDQFKLKKELTQEELDRLLRSQPEQEPKMKKEELPKGLNPATMEKILEFIKEEKNPISAEEVAEGTGLARVTARRYLDHLEKQNKVEIVLQYGGIGRPVNRYQTVYGN